MTIEELNEALADQRAALDAARREIEAIEHQRDAAEEERASTERALRDAKIALARQEAEKRVAPSADVGRELARTQKTIRDLSAQLDALGLASYDAEPARLYTLADQLARQALHLEGQIGEAVASEIGEAIADAQRQQREAVESYRAAQVSEAQTLASVGRRLADYPDLAARFAPRRDTSQPELRIMNAFLAFCEAVEQYGPCASPYLYELNTPDWALWLTIPRDTIQAIIHSDYDATGDLDRYTRPVRAARRRAFPNYELEGQP